MKRLQMKKEKKNVLYMPGIGVDKFLMHEALKPCSSSINCTLYSIYGPIVRGHVRARGQEVKKVSLGVSAWDGVDSAFTA